MFLAYLLVYLLVTISSTMKLLLPLLAASPLTLVLAYLTWIVSVCIIYDGVANWQRLDTIRK